MLFTGYALYVWTKAQASGRSSECNNGIRYFHPVRATTASLRKLSVAALGISLAFLAVFPVIGLLCCSMSSWYWTITGAIGAYISQMAKPLYVFFVCDKLAMNN